MAMDHGLGTNVREVMSELYILRSNFVIPSMHLS